MKFGNTSIDFNFGEILNNNNNNKSKLTHSKKLHKSFDHQKINWIICKWFDRNFMRINYKWIFLERLLVHWVSQLHNFHQNQKNIISDGTCSKQQKSLFEYKWSIFQIEGATIVQRLKMVIFHKNFTNL